MVQICVYAERGMGVIWCGLERMAVAASLVTSSSHVSVCRFQYRHISTASDKRWGEKAWVRGYAAPWSMHLTLPTYRI